MMGSGRATSRTQGQEPQNNLQTRCLSPETNTRPGHAPPSRSEGKIILFLLGWTLQVLFWNLHQPQFPLPLKPCTLNILHLPLYPFTMYSYRYYLDSWVELASQPSSSSLSSAAATEEIVTTGLRVQQQRHRRGFRQAVPPQNLDIVYSHRPSNVNESSQDEYEETESESDHVLSSSNEGLRRQSLPGVSYPDNSSASEIALSSDDDDNLTALGLAPNPSAFTPQPNAFTHPPASQPPNRPRTAFAGPSGSRRNSRSSAHSGRRKRQHQHSPYNMISPSHHVDHEAALRASLSTLLSCAAAARGLPKRDSPPSNPRPVGSRAAEPSAFRLVPESEIDDRTAEDSNRETSQPSSKRSRSPLNSPRKARRKETSRDRSTVPPAKKARGVVYAEPGSIISPTVMTWVISAGVVVLFSAISFSAGYVLGREVGRTEAGQGLYSGGVGDGLSGLRPDSNCGKEAVKGGLKRFRWVGGGSGSGISA